MSAQQFAFREYKMNKIHAVNNIDCNSFTKHWTLQRTREENELPGITEVGSSQLTTKPSELKEENRLSDDAIDSNNGVSRTLKLEKEHHEYKANIRMELFKKILSNEAIQLDFPKFVRYILITILISAASPLVFLLIPAHNLILENSYWYEVLCQAIPWCTWISIYTTYVLGYYLNIDYKMIDIH